MPYSIRSTETLVYTADNLPVPANSWKINILDMWEWFTRYPSARIEDIGTLFEKDLEDQDVVEYDYIIVGGSSCDLHIS